MKEDNLTYENVGNLEGLAGFLGLTAIVASLTAGGFAIYEGVRYVEDLISKTDFSYFIK